VMLALWFGVPSHVWLGPLLWAFYGVCMVALVLTFFIGTSVNGFWWAGGGSVLAVLSIFLVAGLGGTAYYPSLTDAASSLTIANSSSSIFTLKTMFWVSLAIPFVAAYIAYAWHSLDKKKITSEEIEGDGIKY
ncbi:MAG: cytochrome d ubiquinol oxidase subunit II, partial [Bacteroidales bacterium]|nr:cytochrome d ubiquinol oxidase subunit II [Bacteroidales bacterium]